MRLNSKVALLLLGLLIGGVVGYLTRPETAELKVGDTSIQFQNNQVTAGRSGALTSGQSQRILLFALAGGVIGLLVGFAVDRR